MAVARFLPTWLGGEVDHVDGQLPPNVSAPLPQIGGSRPACYCTGECRRNPCHPCNGGIAGRPAQQGWLCTKCGASLSPVYLWCPFCRASQVASPPTYPTSDCGCAPNATCNNVACPRRIQVTCYYSSETEADGLPLQRWETDGGK